MKKNTCFYGIQTGTNSIKCRWQVKIPGLAWGFRGNHKTYATCLRGCSGCVVVNNKKENSGMFSFLLNQKVVGAGT